MFGVGALGVLYTMLSWWMDVIHEAQHGDHTRVVQMSHRYGMILFIASEVMFFVAWFWAYFDVSLFPGETIEYLRTQFTGGHWPPKGIEPFDPWHLPLFNTLILLTSGTTVTWAHHALLHDDRRSLKTGSDPRPSCSAPCSAACRPTNMRMLTSRLLGKYLRRHLLHGDGISWLSRADRDDFPSGLPDPGLLRASSPSRQHLGFEFAAWYWHFVDVVWLFLFACIYVWGSWGAAMEGAAG